MNMNRRQLLGSAAYGLGAVALGSLMRDGQPEPTPEGILLPGDGRTIYSQGQLSNDNYGRDHHGRCFTIFLAGGGIKPGFEYGRTDDYSWNIVKNPVHVRDLHATILHCLGIRHDKLVYPFMGLDQRLTGTEPARVVTELLA